MIQREALEITLEELRKDYTAKRFEPILEADIPSYLYHLWVSRFDNARNVHLNTRICDMRGFFDFVIGEIHYDAKHPCVRKPDLVLEVKLFSRGMRRSAHSHRYRSLMYKDVPKLVALKGRSDSRYALVFDEVGYMMRDDGTGKTKLDRVVEKGIRIAHMMKVDSDLELRFY